MRRWDSLVDADVEEYGACGLTGSYVETSRRELERWGTWLERRRPKRRLEEISADLHVRYVQERTAFRAMATVYGVLSKMWCFGDFLVGQGVWIENTLKWMQGSKLTPYHRMPKRIDGEDMRECLNYTIIVGERHLRRVVANYVRCCNSARTHMSLA